MKAKAELAVLLERIADRHAATLPALRRIRRRLQDLDHSASRTERVKHIRESRADFSQLTELLEELGNDLQAVTDLVGKMEG